jgi:hypothetical protein
LQFVDALLVAGLDAQSLLGSAGRLVVAPYVGDKRCLIGRGHPTIRRSIHATTLTGIT